MKITRDGKQYELTTDEIERAYNEMRSRIWRERMDEAIKRAESYDVMRYDSMSRNDLLNECTKIVEDRSWIQDWDVECDDVLFWYARKHNVWCDDISEDEEEDEE